MSGGAAGRRDSVCEHRGSDRPRAKLCIKLPSRSSPSTDGTGSRAQTAARSRDTGQ